MKRYKRKETFRYTFEEPIAALFEIIEIDDQTVSSSKGEAKIINISPKGMRLNSSLNIPEIDHKSIHLSISFELNNKALNVNGEIVWKKDKGISVDYGINLLVDKSAKKELIKQLKIHSKKVHYQKD